jgi:hypothetical protein
LHLKRQTAPQRISIQNNLSLTIDQKINSVFWYLLVVCSTISLQAFSFAEPQTQLSALSAG